MFIRFTASAFRKLLSIYVFSCFPFGFEGRVWDLIVSVPGRCLSFYFAVQYPVEERPNIGPTYCPILSFICMYLCMNICFHEITNK